MNKNTILKGMTLSAATLLATASFSGIAQSSDNSIKKINAYDHYGNLISSHYAPDVQYIEIEDAVEGSEGITTFSLSNNGVNVDFEMIPVVGTNSYELGADLSWEEADKKFQIKSFFIGETEVTQALWKAVMGNIPANTRAVGDSYPVVLVSYDQICGAGGFLEKLNELMKDQLDGMEFGLPTEAEWEYAANGGILNEGFDYSGSNVFSEVGYFTGTEGGTPRVVKSLNPNGLGIYDMSGNVQEWCSNSPVRNDAGTVVYSANASVRGGSYAENGENHKLFKRGSSKKSTAAHNYGFRLALKEKMPEKKAFTFTFTNSEGEQTTTFFNMIAVPGVKNYRIQSEFVNWPDDEELKTLNPYFIGETEVTNALWKTVMGSLSSTTNTADYVPATQMSWDKICGANGFLEKINKMYEAELDGWEFCLPDEWEWEWAARGASKYNKTTFSGSENLNEVGWNFDNANGAAQHVKTKKPNALGIYDMSGNVWEFTAENYFKNPEGTKTDTNSRTIRGGGFTNGTDKCMYYSRTYGAVPAAQTFGFRLALKKKQQ